MKRVNLRSAGGSTGDWVFEFQKSRFWEGNWILKKGCAGKLNLNEKTCSLSWLLYLCFSQRGLLFGFCMPIWIWIQTWKLSSIRFPSHGKVEKTWLLFGSAKFTILASAIIFSSNISAALLLILSSSFLLDPMTFNYTWCLPLSRTHEAFCKGCPGKSWNHKLRDLEGCSFVTKALSGLCSCWTARTPWQAEVISVSGISEPDPEADDCKAEPAAVKVWKFSPILVLCSTTPTGQTDEVEKSSGFWISFCETIAPPSVGAAGADFPPCISWSAATWTSINGGKKLQGR